MNRWQKITVVVVALIASACGGSSGSSTVSDLVAGQVEGADSGDGATATTRNSVLAESDEYDWADSYIEEVLVELRQDEGAAFGCLFIMGWSVEDFMALADEGESDPPETESDFAFEAELNSRGYDWYDMPEGLVRKLISAMKAECVGIVAASDSAPVKEGGGLRPADEVEEEQSRETALDGELGVRIEMDDGLVVLVNSIELDPDYIPGEAWQPTHIVDLRVENPTSEELSTPDISIWCAGSNERGSWYVGSTYEARSLPPGTFEEGLLRVSVPDEDGVVTQECDAPVVRFKQTGIWFSDDPPRHVDYPAPVLPGP